MYFQYLSFLLLVKISDMRPAAPSQDSDVKDKLCNFLSDVNCRYFFNKVVKFEKEIENLSSKNLFLQKCIDENVIPNTFIVANKPPR